MALGSLQARDRLAAFGLTLVTASALLAAPQLLASWFPAAWFERLLRRNRFLILLARFARKRVAVRIANCLYLALIAAGGYLGSFTSHLSVGLLLLGLGIALLCVSLLAHTIFGQHGARHLMRRATAKISSICLQINYDERSASIGRGFSQGCCFWQERCCSTSTQ